MLPPILTNLLTLKFIIEITNNPKNNNKFKNPIHTY